jgi:hypothetical protein
MGWLRKRLGESSTHVGVALLAQSLQAYLAGGTQAAVATTVAGVFSICYPQSGAK